MVMPRKFTPKQEQEVIRLYLAGLSIQAVAQQVKSGGDAVRNVLLRNDVSRRLWRYKLSAEDVANVISSYRAGVSAEEIGKMFGVNQTSILHHLYKHGVVVRTISEAMRKHTCDYAFFENVDTQERAYILGFAMADGCISNDYHHHGLGFCIQKRDAAHLQKIQQAMKSTHRPKLYADGTVRLYIASRQLIDDLAGYGCVRNKSLVLNFPQNIPSEMLRHFIRGYFEGDGSLWISNKQTARRRPQFSAGFAGTYHFLSSINEIFSKEIGTNRASIVKCSNIYTISYGGNRNIARILGWLYEGATIYLSRKHTLYQKLIAVNSA